MNGFLIAVLVLVFYFWMKYHYNFWKRCKVPYISPQFIVGNIGALLQMSKSPAECILELYNHPKAHGNSFVGIHIFHKPALLLRHPDLIKKIFIKDFAYFCNRYSDSDIKGDPIGSQNIFFLKNPLWKEVRLKLSPFFTSYRIRNMFHLIVEVGRNLNTSLLERSSQNTKEEYFTLEIKELCALYTTDVITNVAFGLNANTLANPNSIFRYHGREIFRFHFKRALGFILVFFLPNLVSFFHFKIIPKEQTSFLRAVFRNILEQREYSGKSRNDLIDLLVKWKALCRNQGQKIEEDVLLSQAAIFFTAGFESSSSTMSFALYELAKAQDIQTKIRYEMREAIRKHNGQISTEFIESLAYMQMVIYEVLRMYPPLPFLDRECTVSNGELYSLQPFWDFSVPNGMPVYVPVYGLHMDPKYFPDPNTFNPERFSIKNKKKVPPYVYMPFGLGPHACIGERFGLLQTKIGLFYFLLNHTVTMTNKVTVNMKLDPRAIIVRSKNGIHLNIKRDPLLSID